MELKNVIENNLNTVTEIGAGPSVASGFFNRKVFKRTRKWLDGRSVEDMIHERKWKIGPVELTHRSLNPKLFSDDDYLLSLSLFKLFVVSNEKDFLIAMKSGAGLKLLKTLLGPTPASIAAEAVDLSVAARAGFRLNVTKLLKELNSGGEPPDDYEERPDLS
ncbi:MAG TPA: hypothetical protein PLN69_07315 [bacterium]|nr:hypothetical protein [bacterium]